jgi:hypothetical protein
MSFSLSCSFQTRMTTITTTSTMSKCLTREQRFFLLNCKVQRVVGTREPLRRAMLLLDLSKQMVSDMPALYSCDPCSRAQLVSVIEDCSRLSAQTEDDIHDVRDEVVAFYEAESDVMDQYAVSRKKSQNMMRYRIELKGRVQQIYNSLGAQERAVATALRATPLPEVGRYIRTFI